mmetsp:Transcript_16441/g.26874  ORF Transcript_16441/g.26874 Transcript_16441/m.26874 type:complete len:441 (-) Transcript_16441:49-1371(-)
MSRYSIALAALLSASTPHLTTADPWSYLSVNIPVALSDMAITTMTISNSPTLTTDDGGDNSTVSTNTNGEVTKKIILTGGCVAEKGNEFLGEYFACLELTNKAFSFEPIAPKTQFQAWTGTFSALPDMPRERARHGSFQVGNNNLCVIGGRDNSDTLIPQIDCYDTTTNAWTEVGMLPDKYQTSDFATFVEGNKVHLIGGYEQGYEALSQVTLVDVSDLEDITFEEGVPINTPRGDIFAVPMDDDTIMISGGFTHLNDFSAPLNSVEQFTFGTQEWGPVAALNEERGDKQLLNLGGKVYAIGGEGRVDASGPATPGDVDALAAITLGSVVLDTVEVLDLTADGEVEWETDGDMPSSLFRFGASTWVADGSEDGDGVIFVFGGQVGFEAECECFRTTEKVLVFDPSKSDTLVQEATPSAGVAMSAVVGHVAAMAAIVLMLV